MDAPYEIDSSLYRRSSPLRSFCSARRRPQAWQYEMVTSTSAPRSRPSGIVSRWERIDRASRKLRPWQTMQAAGGTGLPVVTIPLGTLLQVRIVCEHFQDLRQADQ